MERRGSLSNFWREDASDDRVAELTSVLRGSDSLIGVMGSGVRAVWSTNGESETWWVRTKQGKAAEMRVFLDYSPLRELIPPFGGQAVDEVIGYAAHEGGHCLWSSPDARDEAVGQLRHRPSVRSRQAEMDAKQVEAVLRVANIIEDAYIDYHVGDTWPVLGEYIHISRCKIADRRPIDLETIAQDPRPTYNQMSNLWIACSLYDYPLPKKMSARVRRAMTFLMSKSVEAVQTTHADARMLLSIECWEHLVANFPQRDDPLPRQQPPSQPQPEQEKSEQGEQGEQGEAGGEGEGAETGEGESDAQSKTQKSKGKKSEEDEEAQGDGEGEEGGEEAEPEAEEAGGAGAGDDGDIDNNKEGEPEPEAEPEAEAEPEPKQQEHGHFGGEAGEQEQTGEAEEGGEQGGDELGSPGNLDEFDVRDIEGVPEEVLEEILDAIVHEMEDITRSVAEVINKPVGDVEALTRKADYDGPAAERVRQTVEKEIAEMRRVFDRQASVQSRPLKGLTVGKLDGRNLARVGAGNFRVFKRREILETPDLAVGLLEDVSGSMRSQMSMVWATGCVFAEGLIRKKGVNFLALTYTGGMFEVQTTRICDRDMGRLCLGNVEQGGGTPSGPALASMKILMDRMRERQKVIIHFTDGAPDEEYSVHAAVNELRKAGYQVWAISLHSYAGMLARQYGEGNYETIGSIHELPGRVANLVKKLVVTR